MTINSFQELIPKIEKTVLPGIESQFKMAPIMRKKLGKDFDFKSRNPKKAAVMALMYPDAEGHLQMIFMLRKTYEGVHSNQIGFPGGKIENEDSSILATAFRETEEEIGVKSKQIQVLKELTQVYIPPSNFLVQPFIGLLNEKPRYILDEKEVERLIEVPLSDVLSDDSLSVMNIETSYSKEIEVPIFKFQEEVVWGATAMMLSEIKDLLLIAK